MKQYAVFYNPLSQKNRGFENARKLEQYLPGARIEYMDMTQTDLRAFLDKEPAETAVIFTGGDGTLNRVINLMDERDREREILFYPSGTGNDFIRDIGKEAGGPPFSIHPYTENLPEFDAAGRRELFINGTGLGLDGYTCAEHDRYLKKGKTRSYTFTALKGVLFGYKPVAGRITVDGITESYGRIWMADAMLGKYEGGGIKVAPEQDRLNPEHKLTVVVIHDVGRLAGLILSSLVMKGHGHLFPKYISYRRGHHIEIELEEATDFQTDGEVEAGIRSAVINFTEPDL